MSTTVLVILVAVGAVGLFVIGMSLTLMIKGHHIKSEISDNENMQRLGIKCAAQQMREEERALRGEGPCVGDAVCTDHNCGSCGSHGAL